MGAKRKSGRPRSVKEDTSPKASLETENAEEVNLHNENSNAADSVIAEDAIPSKGKKSKTAVSAVRRSTRIKSPVRPIQTETVKPVAVDHVNLDDNEKEEDEDEDEDEESNVKEASTMPIIAEKNEEENFDHRVLPTRQNKFKNVKEVTEKPIPSPSAGINYKSLYFDSQKKIDMLMEQNFNLVKKLEFCRGQLEAYEKMKDLLVRPQELILINNSGKAIERPINLLPQTMAGNSNTLCDVAPTDADNDLNKSPKERKYTRRGKKVRK